MKTRIASVILAAILLISIFAFPAQAAASKADLTAAINSAVAYSLANPALSNLISTDLLMGLDFDGRNLNDSAYAALMPAPIVADASTPTATLAAAIINGKLQGQNMSAEIAMLQSRQVPGTGFTNGAEYDSDFGFLYAMMALDMAGASYNTSDIINVLNSSPKKDGMFAFEDYFTFELTADPDTTGLALFVLSNHTSDTVARAMIDAAKPALKNLMTSDGNIPGAYGISASSQAMVILGLTAIGEDVRSSDWSKGGNSLLDWLMTQQNTDGSFRSDPTSIDIADGFSTRQAVMSLAYVKQDIIRRENLNSQTSSTSSTSSTVPVPPTGDGAPPYMAFAAVIMALGVVFVLTQKKSNDKA